MEQAFLTSMVHHHETALDMAMLAQRHGEDTFIKQLAGSIITTQEGEIDEMKSIHKRLFGTELKPDPLGHDQLGLTAGQAGMTHDEDTNRMLQAADPFDRAFVDDMVPHHRGAIAMSNVVLDRTEDRALRDLAEKIIEAQRREIKEMNVFRTEKFDGPAPAGAEHGGAGAETSPEKEHEMGH